MKKYAIEVAAFAMLLTGCGVTAGQPAIEVASAPPQTGLYRLTEADIAVPPAADFLGQAAALLDDTFGAPALRHTEGDAEVRQYKTEAPFGPCVLIAVLYPQGDENVLRIADVNVRENGATAAAPIHCLRELAFAYQGPPAG